MRAGGAQPRHYCSPPVRFNINGIKVNGGKVNGLKVNRPGRPVMTIARGTN